jgi:hypothetical protein
MLRPATNGRIVAGLIIAIAVIGCGKSSVSQPAISAPTSPSAPAGEPVIDIAGNWVGTIESANLGTQTISMIVTQFADCVDGSWRSADGEWSGAISGFARRDSFTGQISFERRSGGGCLAVGNVGGPVESDMLHWTGIGATPIGQCAGEVPQRLAISMRRQ